MTRETEYLLFLSLLLIHMFGESVQLPPEVSIRQIHGIVLL